MKAFVTGLGWVTSAGMGRGRSGDRFAFGKGELPILSRQRIFADPYPRFGRLDDFSRLGLAGIALALADGGFDHCHDKRNIGLFAATILGSMATDITYFDSLLPERGGLASPNLFAYTLSSTFLGEAAIRFGLSGPGFVANLTGKGELDPFVLGLEGIAFNDCESAVCGFCNTSVPSVDPSNGQPEGALFLVLERSGLAGGHSYGILCRQPDGQIFVDDVPVPDCQKMVEVLQSNLPEHK
ncbi:MAG: hypothetical protein GX751_08790 [Desulfuromonadaceae bacterium]|nr:hypothetical protein [Desulfuromonadaceae bacterium]